MSPPSSRRVIELLDTSIVVEVLEVPGKSSKTSDVVAAIERKQSAGTRLFIAAAALIETGGHVSRIEDGTLRRACAQRFKTLIEKTLDGYAPWSLRPLSWDEPFLRALIRLPGQGHDMVQAIQTKYLQFGDLGVLQELLQLRANLDPTAVEVKLWTLDEKLDAASQSA